MIVAVSSSDSNAFISCSKSAGVQANFLGRTIDSGMMQIKMGEKVVLSTSIADLHLVWEHAIPDCMEPSRS